MPLALPHRLKALRIPRIGVSAHVAWPALCVLLGLGVLTSLVDLVSQSRMEVTRAIADKQRMVFAASGEAEGVVQTEAKPKKSDFDVADEDAASKAVAEEQGPGLAPTSPPEPETLEGTALNTSPAMPVVTIHRSEESLMMAPAPEVSEKKPEGFLPVVKTPGITASTLYAKDISLQENVTPIAVVVTGLGYSADAMNVALTTPPNVTLSFSPYAPNLYKLIATARDAGFEPWVDLPSQTGDYPSADPGPLAMITSLQVPQLKKRLRTLMIDAHGVVGAVLLPESTLLQFPETMNLVLEQLHTHGLSVLLGLTLTPDQLPSAPEGMSLRAATHIIPATASPTQIRALMTTVFNNAREQQAPQIIVLPANPTRLQALKKALEPLAQNDVVALVPLSVMYRDIIAEKAALEKAKEDAAKKGDKKEEGGH